jgi:tRNA(Ile)-lysidine synthase TilS/MesJ
MAREVGATCLSVAHHADDQLETMLMALCRGGGIRKLAGMAESRMLTEHIALVRPLLQTEKFELRNICTLASVQWCEDPTNRNLQTPRGRLRKDVIPVLRELWSSSDKHAAQASRILHAAADAYEALAPSGNTWKRKDLAELPTPIIAESIHLALGVAAKHETVHAIAVAIQDANVQPRVFECSNGFSVHISVHTVEVCHI